MLASAIANGLALGAIYALVGAGLNLIFGVVKIINFAQGAMLMAGMYLVYWWFQLFGFDPYLSLPVVLVLMFGLGYTVQRLIINRVLRQERTSQLLITFGIGMVLQNTALALWGPNHRSVRSFLTGETLELLGARVSMQHVAAFFGATLAVLLLFFFLKSTRYGTAIRAVAQQPDSAELAGINVKSVYAVAFGIGTAVTGFAAVLMAPIYDIQPLSGDLFGVIAFIAVVMGGLGNVQGAAAAGVILGLSQVLFATFVGPQFATAFLFLFFVATLIIRPTGLFGRKERIA